MRVAVIADIHGNSAALDAVLADIETVGADITVNLGDCLSGPLDAKGTADRLMAADFPTVMGNHDLWLTDRPPERMPPWDRWAHEQLWPEALDWLRALPATRNVAGLFLCHGTPSSNTENWLDVRQGTALALAGRDHIETAAHAVPGELLLCGHTHVPRVLRLSDGRLVVNPGSVGCPGYAVRFLAEPYALSTGAPDARYAILEKRDTWQAQLRTVAYDPRPMAELAKARGDVDFAQALLTGWVDL